MILEADSVEPHAHELEVLYEDAGVLAVCKPSGQVVHPTYRNTANTLAQAVFARQEALGEDKPCLLHRLDKDTSGVVLFAKSELARRAIVSQIIGRTMKKVYLALVVDAPPSPDGVIDFPLMRDPADRKRVIAHVDGQDCETYYRTLAAGPDATLLEVRPRTGRMHQIRAHLTAIGCPIIGDSVYAPEDRQAERLMLHAWRVTVRQPGTGEPLSVAATPPEPFVAILRAECPDGVGAMIRSAQAGHEEES